ncbi:hypothetical protein R9C00_25145 [Flammeovirgaceae bacterium SG7u.111]|nr:hypothetical protein [Flammeovirgaceae bacterium SG7u.132]WPO34984.1 hypothetical protein R9C00_25145 [Flammeovirgaceae bacterium SG7u.111]
MLKHYTILFIWLLLICGYAVAQTDVEGDAESWNDFYNESFQPFTKGNWHTNLVLNFSQTEESNQINLLANVIDGNTFSYGVGFSGGYFFKDEMSAGLNIKFNRSNSNLNTLQDADTVNTKRLNHSFAFTPFLRNYIPLSKNNRFSVFNETGLTFGYGQTLRRKTVSEDKIEKYYGESYIARFGIRPGINAFIVENFSFEIAIDLIGFEMDYIKSDYGNGQTGDATNLDFNFKIDLLSLNFGVAYYF